MTIRTETHPATVMATNDPEERGRIRIACTALLGDEDAELPMWVEPLHDWGWFYVPDVDEIIDVEVISGSHLDESFGQSSLDNLDIKWRGQRYYGNTEGDQPTAIHEFFTAENYGKRRGFATPFGHVIMLDDTSGSPKITVTWVSERLATAADKISQIVLDTDGTIWLINKGSHTIHLKDGEVEIKLNGGAGLTLTGSGSNATTVFGDGGVVAAIADHLQTFYGTFAGIFDSHTHTTTATVSAGSPGVVAPTVTPFPAWLSSINSSKLKFPDG